MDPGVASDVPDPLRLPWSSSLRAFWGASNATGHVEPNLWALAPVARLRNHIWRWGPHTGKSMVATASPKLWMYPEAAEPSAYSQPIVVFVRRIVKFAHRVLARSSSLFAVGRREGRVVLQERYFRSTTPPGAASRRLELRPRRFAGIEAWRGALREPSCRAPGAFGARSIADVVRRPPARFSFDETAYVGNRIG